MRSCAVQKNKNSESDWPVEAQWTFAHMGARQMCTREVAQVTARYDLLNALNTPRATKIAVRVMV